MRSDLNKENVHLPAAWKSDRQEWRSETAGEQSCSSHRTWGASGQDGSRRKGGDENEWTM